MQLVERGIVDLDAPAVKYLPYFRLADDRYSQITVRQMVTHTSGMPDVDDYEWDKPQYDDGALERYVRSLTNQKLLFAPGERVQYSNMAFEILGDVVAKASGESFDDYVQRHILAPLQMTDSTVLLKQTNPTLPVIVRSRERVTTQRAYDAEIPLVVHLAPMDLHPDQEQTLAEMRPAESDPRVISQKPQSGGVLRGGGTVNVVVSRRKDRS